MREAHLAILRESFGDQAEAMYQYLKTGYEVDRRVGLFRAGRADAAVDAALDLADGAMQPFCLH